MALPKTSYIEMSLERPDADDIDIEYHRNKAKNKRFRQTFHSNILTLQYLDNNDIEELLHKTASIKNSLGGEFNFKVAGNSIDTSSFLCQTDGVVSAATPGSNMLPSSVQATTNPYSSMDSFALDFNGFDLALGGFDSNEDWIDLGDMPAVPNIETAEVQQGALSDQAGDATQSPVLPSDVTKTLVVEQSAFSYPTPSTICYNSPSTEMRGAACTPPATNTRKREGREYGTARRKRKRTARSSPATGSNPVVHTLLKSCVFRKGQRNAKDGNQEDDNTEILNEEQIQGVLQAGAHLVSNDFCASLRSHLENWEKNKSQNLHPLGIPAQWQGTDAAAENFIKIDSDDIADLVGTRVAPLLLYINCREMYKRPEEFCSRQRKKGEQKKTLVLDCIIDKILDKVPGYFDSQQDPKTRRDLVSDQVRHGRWWWKLSRGLGLGVLLLCSKDLFKKMRNATFKNAQIDALRTYASYVRPGTIRLLQSLSPIVRTIIFGEVPSHLVYALQSDGSPLFGDSELTCANNEDEAALANLNPEIPWANVVPENEDYEDVWKILYDRAEENS